MSRPADAIAPSREQDPVLTALAHAPLDDLPETEEERRAVAEAKASRRLKPHAAVEAMIESRRKGG